jgi:organic radical activating enzyme
VIITGGEPSIHNLLPLLKELKCSGFWIAIETNGSISLNEYMNYLDYVSLSPKFEINQTNADELRIVNDGKSCKELLDFENIIAARYYYLSPLYLNNSFNYLETLNLLGTINRVSQNHWHLSIQMHKLADIP